MKRRILKSLVIVMLAATLLLSACQSYAPVEAAQPDTPAEPEPPSDQAAPAEAEPTDEPEEPAPGMTIAVAEVGDLGQILVDGEGYTLYVFLNDNPGSSSCTGNCASSWPPLLVDAEVAAGDGLEASLVGTITRDDGTTQVTYNGKPLYYYYKDDNPGDANGQATSDVWFVISPLGDKVGAAGDEYEDYNPDY